MSSIDLILDLINCIDKLVLVNWISKSISVYHLVLVNDLDHLSGPVLHHLGVHQSLNRLLHHLLLDCFLLHHPLYLPLLNQRLLYYRLYRLLHYSLRHYLRSKHRYHLCWLNLGCLNQYLQWLLTLYIFYFKLRLRLISTVCFNDKHLKNALNSYLLYN